MTTMGGLFIEPGYESALRDAGLTSVAAFMQRPADGPATSVHVDRETVPIVLTINGARRRFYLKRSRDDARRPKAWAGAGPMREWQAIGLLAGWGIPTMQRVACGECREGGKLLAFLLIEAVPAEKTVADWLGEASRGPVSWSVRRLIRDLGDLAGRLQARDLHWPDAHPRHVFARPSDGGRAWCFWLIDLQRISRRATKPADFRVFLRRLLPFELSRREQLAFWSGFSLAAGVGRHEPCRLPEDVLSSGPRPARPRCAGSPSSLSGPRHDCRDAGARALLSACGLSTAADLLNHAGGADLSKPGLAHHRRRRRLTAIVAGQEHTLYLKQFDRPGGREQLARLARGGRRDSTAWREWHFIRRLEAVGVPTMHCLAVAAEMNGWLERRSAIVTAAVPGESLERWLPRAWSVTPRAHRNELITQVAAIARRMHWAGLFHRDFYVSHVFVAWMADGLPAVHVIDLGRMIEDPFRPERWRIKDLAALDYSAAGLSRTDRLRFLRAYAPAWAGPARRAARHERFGSWIRQIAARAGRMARHDRRKGGP